jgi:hypothetical protein
LKIKRNPAITVGVHELTEESLFDEEGQGQVQIANTEGDTEQDQYCCSRTYLLPRLKVLV